MTEKAVLKLVRVVTIAILVVVSLAMALVLAWLDYRGSLSIQWYDILSPPIAMALIVGVGVVLLKAWNVVSEALDETARHEKEGLR